MLSSRFSFLGGHDSVERLSFEIKGIEKLDVQWFATQKPLPGSKQKRGEYVFLDGSTTAMVANQIVSAGSSKSYVVRTLLPSIIPPSYKGSTVRYFYYVKSALVGEWLVLENGQSFAESVQDVTNMEVRIPLQVWVNQKSSGLLMEEELVPSTTVQMDIYWKVMDGDTDWVRANDINDALEDGYDSSRDEVSSVSSYNPVKDNLHRSFGSSFSLHSSSARSLSRDPLEGSRMSLSSQMALPRLSVAEVLHDSAADVLSPQKFRNPFSAEEDAGVSSSPEAAAINSASSEGFIRGRSYNIRLDDQVLLKFSPKNSDSNYYFSDMIGGTLTFFHEERARRCLEVSITLETSETINRRFVHPSRKHSPTITKVQSDHYEVVADLVQTSFLSLFEFYATPKNLDWTKYEHLLLIEGREKCEWVLPITVHAPPPRTSGTRSEKPVSLDPLWVHN
ncbi:hypothetical protein K1719_024086 [Acacia pycnantha]|nr:hypothetical protein K1719_024086 [Acacia pycnantha]